MFLSFNGNSLGLMAGCMFSDIKVAMAVTPVLYF